MHKTSEIITQTQEDDSSCFDDVSSKPLNSSTRSYRSLWTVRGRFKRQNRKQHRVSSHHSVRAQSVAVVTQAHNARRAMSSLPTSTFPRSHLIAAVDIHISQTATTLAVVFESFYTVYGNSPRVIFQNKKRITCISLFYNVQYSGA